MMSVNGAWARVVTVSVAAEIGAAVTGADAETGAEVWIFGAEARARQGQGTGPLAGLSQYLDVE